MKKIKSSGKGGMFVVLVHLLRKEHTTGKKQ